MAEARPRLAVVYGRAAITPMELFEAARPVAELLWVMDAADDVLSPLLPLIRRMGAVLDTAGRSDEEVVAMLEPQPPEGVIVFAEPQLALAARIAERFDLRFHRPPVAALLTNKARQRAALAAGGLPGPRFWPFGAGADASERERIAVELPYPVVLKPQEGLGSRQTTLVPDAPALAALLADFDSSPEDMLIEELLEESRPRAEQRLGETLMVDTLSGLGRRIHHTICGHFIPAPPFRGAGTFTPIHLTGAETAVVLEATEAALAALDIEHGFTNTDLILTPDGPRVLEVNGRIGGEVPALRALLGAPGLLREAIRFAVGAPGVEVAPLETSMVAFCVNCQAPAEARRLRGLSGLDEVSALEGVTSVVVHRRAGDPIDWRIGTMSRLCAVYGVVGDHDRLYDLHREIDRLVVPDYATD